MVENGSVLSMDGGQFQLCVGQHALLPNGSVLSMDGGQFQLCVGQHALLPVESFLGAASRRNSKHYSLISETE